MGKNDITQGQANSTSMPYNQKVNKADELTYLSINIKWDINSWLN